MAFDFPASPAEGTQFTPAGGPTYVFKSGVWTVPSIGSIKPLTADTRNRIVNPCMQISQENGDTASISTAYYPADQWLASWTSAVGQAGSNRSEISPNGSKYVLHQYVNVADTALATEWLGVYQIIEGTTLADFRWGTVAAKQVVLRFWAFSTVAGTYGGAIRNFNASRTFVFSFVLSANAWTEFVVVIPGDTAGTWLTDNSMACQLWFTWAASSAQCGTPGIWQNGTMFGATGQSNGFSVAGNHFYIADVGLYADPLKTGVAPPLDIPAYDDDLRHCQRYYYRLELPPVSAPVAAGNLNATTEARFPFQLPVQQRTAGTFSTSGAANFDVISALSTKPSSVGLVIVGSEIVMITAAVTGHTAGQGAHLRGSGNAWISFNARM